MATRDDGLAGEIPPMRRVSVVGNSGSGKTTLARELADRLGVPYVELDAIFHQPGWQQLPKDQFRERVSELVARPGWVVDGNYSSVRDLVLRRADTVLWLDPPRRRVMRQIIWRTTSRAVLRRELWNGNRERIANLFRLDPDQSVISWAWVKHTHYRQTYRALSADPELGHLRFVRLESRTDIRRLLEQVR